MLVRRYGPVLMTKKPAVVGPGFDAATVAWAAAVVAAGGTVSAPGKTIVDTLIKGLKTDGLFANGDRLWYLCGENTHQAQIDLIALQSWTAHGSPTFTAGHGYTGDASAAYLDTNFNPTSAAGNFTQNGASIAAYVLNSRTTGQDQVAIAGTDGTTFSDIFPKYLDGNAYSRVNAQGPHVATANAQALWVGSRTASNASALYKNGSSVATDATAVTGLLNFNLAVFAYNGTSPASFSGDQIGFVWIGGALNATQAGNLTTRVNAAATSLGINTF